MVQRALNHCEHCNVDVDAAFQQCPLCRAPLARAAAENDLYGPIQPPAPRRRTFYKDLLVFLSIFFVVGALAINLIEWRGTPWFLALAAVVACLWIEQRIFASSYLFGTKVFLQVVCAGILTLSFDYVAGWSGWALGELLPLVLMAANVAIDIYAYWYKSRWKPSLLYGLLFAALGFVPLILYLSHVTQAFWPMLLCLVSSIVSLLGMMRFALRTLHSELKKRFHF